MTTPRMPVITIGLILTLGGTTGVEARAAFLLEENSNGGVDQWLQSAFQVDEEDYHQQYNDNDDTDPYQFMDGVWSVTIPNPKNANANPNATTTTTSTTTPFGYANIPHQIPMTAEHVFPIGSNSKLYTAVALYQLHERGALDLSANVASLLDAQDFEQFGFKPHEARALGRHFCFRLTTGALWRGRCQTVTVHHLLSMSSGLYPALICNVPPQTKTQCHQDAYFVSVGSISKTIGTFIKEPLIFEPGSQFHYTNVNFILATYLVEKYSGMPFGEYLETHIVSKLKRSSSSSRRSTTTGSSNRTYYDYYNQALGLDPLRVEQYTRFYDNTTAPRPTLMAVGKDVLQLDAGVTSGTGGIMATVQDLAAFWYTLFDKETRGAPLVTAASQRAILTPWTLIGTGHMMMPNNGNNNNNNNSTANNNKATPVRTPVWQYYTQGTIIICVARGCPQGPKYILYEGGTITVHTANILDYADFRMSQVWTSTLVAMTDRDTYQAAVKRQAGTWIDIYQEFCWNDQSCRSNIHKAFQKLLEHSTSEAAGTAAAATTASMQQQEIA